MNHHAHNIPKAVQMALENSKFTPADLSAIAVTIGPGQLPSLKQGIEFAKALGHKFDLPVIPVNHLEAHIMTARMRNRHRDRSEFPFVSVLATGAHTEIVLTRGPGLHTIMGFTVDIAIGTFIDSVAREVGKRVDIINDLSLIHI